MAEDINLDEFQGLGAIPPSVNPDDVGLYSKSAAMKLIDQRNAQTAALQQKYNVPPSMARGGGQLPKLPEYNSALPAPAITGGVPTLPTTPEIDGIQTTPVPTANDLLKNLHNNINSHGIQAKADMFAGSRQIAYDARNPLYQNQYYDRYESKVDELGFSPFRDNEKVWNENASTWDDLKRASGQWWTLTSLAFADAAGLGGDELSVAKQQERAFAIGSSSREGFGGWATNFYLNSGFTVGILAELAIEEMILMGGQALATMSAPLHMGSANVAIGTLQAARFGRAMDKLYKGYKAVKNIGKTLDKYKDINQLRKTFTAFGKGTAKFLNPAENLTDFYKNYDKLDGLTNVMKTSKGLGAAYRDYRNISLAWSEGGMEGGSVELEMQRDLYDKFVEDNGRIPTTAEADALRQKANEAGLTTKLINAPLILLSNKLTFDGLVRPRIGSKVASDLIESGLGKKILMNPKAELGKVFSVAPAKWKVAARAKMFYKNPKLLAKGVTTYAEANWAEGLQELAQETISGASKDYYLNHYSGDATRGGFMSYMSSVGKNLGGEDPFGTFMSGFLMGGAIKPVSNVIAASTGGSPTLNNMYLKFKNKEEYNRIKTNRNNVLNQTVKELNEVYKDPSKYFAPDLENLQEQQQLQQDIKIAEKNNDAKTYYDLKDASLTKHVMTALRTGKVDTFIQRMQEQKNLSEEEVLETYGMTKSEFDKQLDHGINQATAIQDRYDIAVKQFTNPFDPEKFRDKESAAYAQESYRKKAWDDAVEQMVTMQGSFDRALKRKESILGALKEVSQLNKTAASEFTHLESLSSLETEISNLTEELKAIDELKTVTDPKLVKVQKQKQKKVEALKKYREAVQKNIYEKEDDSEELTPEQYDEITEAFTEYTNVVAEEAGDFTNITALDKASRNMTDAHFLGIRAKKLNAAVNTLIEPKGFVREVERKAALIELIHKNRAAEIENSLKEFLKLKDNNDMLGELATELGENNMFVDPEDLMELIKTGKVPKQIYYLADKADVKGKTQVHYRSSDYAKVVAIFENYVDHVHGIELTEEDTNPYAVKVHRPKDSDDKRKYKDLADQYGFDPAAASSTVPLVQVLDTIAKSEYATDNEKALAETLMNVVDRKETVTFVNNGTVAGKYNKNEQTVIDARYSSIEYGTGQGPAIETSILKQEILRRTDNSLENDKEFNKKITDIMKEAGKFYAGLNEQDKVRLFGKDAASKIPAAFGSPQEFVQSAMNDPKFQEMLAMIKTDATQETSVTPTWMKFIDAVLEAISKAFGNKPNGTLLNSTMDLITSTIDSQYTEVSKKGKTKITKPGQVRRGSQYTPAELMAIDDGKLGNLVLQEFKDENARREEDGNNPLLEGYETMSPQEILSSTAFKNYLKDPTFTKKERIIRDYVVTQPVETTAETSEVETPVGKPITVEQISLQDVTQSEYDNWVSTGAPGLSQNTIYKLAQKVKNRSLRTQAEEAMLADTKTMGVVNDLLVEMAKGYPRTVNTKMKTQLKELGYKLKEIRNMGAAVAQDTIWEGLTKAEKESASIQPSKNQMAQQEVDDFNNTIQELFNAITRYDQLITIKDGRKINKFKNSIQVEYGSLSADAQILFGDTEILMNKLNEMETEKLQELANSNNFADINVGEIILLNNQYETQAKVISKTADELTYEFIKMDKGVMTPIQVTVKAEEVNDKIKYAAGSAQALTELESRKTEEELTTPEVKAQTEESQAAAKDINTQEEIQKDIEASKNLSKEDRDNNLLDNLCK